MGGKVWGGEKRIVKPKIGDTHRGEKETFTEGKVGRYLKFVGALKRQRKKI